MLARVSVAVQWLRPCASTAGGAGSSLSLGGSPYLQVWPEKKSLLCAWFFGWHFIHAANICQRPAVGVEDIELKVRDSSRFQGVYVPGHRSKPQVLRRKQRRTMYWGRAVTGGHCHLKVSQESLGVASVPSLSVTKWGSQDGRPPLRSPRCPAGRSGRLRFGGAGPRSQWPALRSLWLPGSGLVSCTWQHLDFVP